MVRDALARGDIASIDPILAEETLSEADRRSWGLIHPDLMGGEYLPDLDAEDVEIARISLRSTLSDQISIRAARAGDKIRYSVCDEYETEYRLAVTESELPLTLGELIALIDGSGHPEEEKPGGLLVCHWENMLEWSYPLDECIDFASIDSAWYPELTGITSKWPSTGARRSARSAPSCTKTTTRRTAHEQRQSKPEQLSEPQSRRRLATPSRTALKPCARSQRLPKAMRRR